MTERTNGVEGDKPKSPHQLFCDLLNQYGTLMKPSFKQLLFARGVENSVRRELTGAGSIGNRGTFFDVKIVAFEPVNDFSIFLYFPRTKYSERALVLDKKTEMDSFYRDILDATERLYNPAKQVEQGTMRRYKKIKSPISSS